MASHRLAQGRTRPVPHRRLLPLLVAAAMAAPTLPTAAATFRWLGGAPPLPTFWSNAVNWVPVGAPTGLSFADVLEFDGSFGASVNNVRDNFILNGIRVLADANGTVSGQSLLLSGASGTTPFIAVGTDGTLTLASALAGGNDWNKLGTGTLRLTGSNIGYTGTVHVTQGELSAAGNGALGIGTRVDVGAEGLLRIAAAQSFARLSGAGQVRLDAQANVGLDGADSVFSGRFTGGASLSKSGNGRLALSGASEQFLGAVTVAAGVLDLAGANALTQASEVNVASGSTLRIGAAQSLAKITGNGTVQLDAPLTLGKAGSDFTFEGRWVGASALTTNGGHITLTGGSPDFSGSIVVNTGILEFAEGAAAGTQAAVTVNAAGELIAGDLNTTFGSLAGSGRVTIVQDSFYFGTNGTDTAFSGNVTGVGAFVKVGDGVFTFSGTKTGTGDLGVRGGVFAVVGGSGSSEGVKLTGGRLELQGAQSTWTVSESVSITSGHRDTSLRGITVLRLTDGASLTSASGSVVDNAATDARGRSDAMVEIRGRSTGPDGAASTWTVQNLLTLGAGFGRYASLEVGAGGHLATGVALLGSGAYSSADVVVDGADGPSSWTNDGAIVVGQNGSGFLGVRNGGRVDTGSMSFGEARIQTGPNSISTGHGSMIVTGRSADGFTPSTVAITGELRLGGVGVGRLFVEERADFSAASAVLGVNAGGSGEMWVTGPVQDGAGPGLSTATFSGALEVGRAGSGVIHVLDGGQLVSGGAVIGGTAGGNGLVELASRTGAPLSRWIAPSIDVGTGGTGTLRVDAGGRVHTGAMHVGRDDGVAVVELRDGGTLFTGPAVIGGKSARVTLASAPTAVAMSQWFVSGFLDIGDAGSTAPDTARLEVLDGGSVSNSGQLRVHTGGRVVLDGGALQTNGIAVDTGGNFDWRRGLLNVPAVSLGSSAWSPSLMVLTSGQELQANRLDVNGGLLGLDGGRLNAQRVTLTGGTLFSAAGFDDTRPGLGSGSFGVLEGPGTLAATVKLRNGGTQIVASGGVLTVGNANRVGAFEFGGSARVAGAGRLLILSADRGTLGRITTLEAGGVLQSINGLLLLSGRVLEATGSAEVVGDFTNQGTVRGPTAAGQALVFNDAVDGAGAFTGNIRFDQTHSPGNSPAIQSFENVTYASTATLVIEILGVTPGTQHDRVDVSGLATLGGTLDVRFLGGFAPAPGASFVVMTWGTRAGSFAALDVSGLDPALHLTANYGEHALTLSMSTAPVPEPGEWALMLAGLGIMGWSLRRRAAAG